MIETRVGLQAALYGQRTKAAMGPATPVSVEELARHAACVAVGARARSTSLRCDLA